jgi:hypothetical protein
MSNYYLEWRKLSSIYCGNSLVQFLAAACDDGIGIIARWTRDGDKWVVEAMDTENNEGMQLITDFHERECVPPEPPETV